MPLRADRPRPAHAGTPRRRRPEPTRRRTTARTHAAKAAPTREVLLAEYDNFIFDSDGVLFQGSEPIQGSI